MKSHTCIIFQSLSLWDNIYGNITLVDLFPMAIFFPRQSTCGKGVKNIVLS